MATADTIDGSDDDRVGMTEEQWAVFKRLTSGFGDQDENGVDLSLLRENLKLTPTERVQKLQRSLYALHAIGRPIVRML